MHTLQKLLGLGRKKGMRLSLKYQLKGWGSLFWSFEVRLLKLCRNVSTDLIVFKKTKSSPTHQKTPNTQFWSFEIKLVVLVLWEYKRSQVFSSFKVNIIFLLSWKYSRPPTSLLSVLSSPYYEPAVSPLNPSSTIR